MIVSRLLRLTSIIAVAAARRAAADLATSPAGDG
jgi:hypothetical protein